VGSQTDCSSRKTGFSIKEGKEEPKNYNIQPCCTVSSHLGFLKNNLFVEEKTGSEFELVPPNAPLRGKIYEIVIH
jgi:hypothetical protein